jgi:tetratricopeptide (TPR) repeat protein
LEKHGTAKGAKEVWAALIALLVRSDNRTEEAAEVALKAISHHPNDRNLIANYLRFFDSSEDEQVVRKFYERLMAAYPRDNKIPAYFAAWLRDHNHQDEAHVIYSPLIYRAPRDFGAHYGYGRLLLNLEEYEKAAEQFREALRIHKGHQMAHDGLAQVLCGLGKLAEQKGRVEEANQHFMKAEREFRQALYWADAQEESQAIFYTHLGWFYIDRGSYPEALEAFKSAMDEDPNCFLNYWGQGRALIGLGQFQAAAEALHTALEKAPEDLQPPASEEIPELLRQCQESAQV